MRIRVLAVWAATFLCASVSPLRAQMVNTPPPTLGLKAQDKACAKFYLYKPKDLMDGTARDALWGSSEVQAFVDCVVSAQTRFQAEMAKPETDGHDALISEFNRQWHLRRWYSDIRDSYNKFRSGKTLAALGGAADLEASVTGVFASYDYEVNKQLKSHSLLQPFSGVLKAGASFLERGSSTSTATTPAADSQDSPGSSTTSNGSPLAHIDFESKHFGAEKGSRVDASFTSAFGFQPALAFFKPAPKTINGETTNAAEATAYQTAFVFNVGGNLHMATFQTGELSLSGRVGAVNLMSDVNVVDQGGQSYIAIPFGGDSTRLFSEVGVQANLYNGGIELAHLEKSSLMPLFHAEAGIRRDPRFEAAGSKYFKPGLRTYLRVSADNVPVLGQVNGESKTFSLAFAWEYDGPFWGSAPADQVKIPSGNRFVIRGDVNLLKALKPDIAAPPAAAGKPDAPVAVNAAIRPDGRIELSWKADPTASTYAVYRRVDPATPFAVAASNLRVSPDAQTVLHVDAGVADSDAVTYQVTAFRGSTESDRSAEFKPPRKSVRTGSLTSGTATSGGSAPGASTGARQTLTIDVFDKEHGGRVVAHVAMDDNPATIERDTDGNGHIEFNLPPGPRGFTVTANEYEPVREAAFDNSLFGDPPGSVPRHVDVRLVHRAGAVAPAPKPSRSTVMNLRANFFGALDCRGARMFDPMIAVVPDRECWYRVKRDEGLTHIVLSPAFQYPGFTPFDWWHNDPAQFRELVLDVLNHGFVPVIFLAQGEHFTDARELVDSDVPGRKRPVTSQALVEHLDRDFTRMLTALKDLTPFCIWVPGWEVKGPPEEWWSSSTVSHAILKMRALLGDQAIIGLHLQPERVTWASFPKEPDDPSDGDEIGAMSRAAAGKEISMLLYQMAHDRHMADEPHKPGSGAYDRVVESLARFIRGYVGPNGETGPFWFQNRVGPLGEDGATRDEAVRFCAFETGALNVKDGHFGPEKLKVIAQRLQQLGVKCFGNGIP